LRRQGGQDLAGPDSGAGCRQAVEQRAAARREIQHLRRRVQHPEHLVPGSARELRREPGAAAEGQGAADQPAHPERHLRRPLGQEAGRRRRHRRAAARDRRIGQGVLGRAQGAVAAEPRAERLRQLQGLPRRQRRQGAPVEQDYLAALTAVAEAEAAFDKGLGARDQALTKEAFEKAPKDTAAYYRAGLIYHGKLNHADASALFAAPNDPKALAAFEASLALVADSAAGWSKKMAEQSSQSGKSCSGGMLQINEFIGQSRSMVKDIKDGVFARKETGAMARMPAHMRSSSIVSSANRYNQNFANMIGQFNHPLC
jgi:hypothetical protein